MSAVAKDSGSGDFQKVPPGTHIAVCNMVVMLGWQPTAYQGEDTGFKPQVYIRWETPHERIEYEVDGVKKEGPLCIGKTYTLSLNEKANLRKDLEGWRSKAFDKEELEGFDIDNVLGTCCQVIVTHRESASGRTYANVTGIAGFPKSMDRMKAENALISYAEDNTKQFDKLNEWLQKKINSQSMPSIDENVKEEEKEITGPEPGDDFDDDIPF